MDEPNEESASPGLGDGIDFERDIKPKLFACPDGWLVFIDQSTGDWETGPYPIDAYDRLCARRDPAGVTVRRVGPRKPLRDVEREAFFRLGDDIYRRVVQPLLKPEDDYKWVCLDVDTEAFEVDANRVECATRLRARVPNARVWSMQINVIYHARPPRPHYVPRP